MISQFGFKSFSFAAFRSLKIIEAWNSQTRGILTSLLDYQNTSFTKLLLKPSINKTCVATFDQVSAKLSQTYWIHVHYKNWKSFNTSNDYKKKEKSFWLLSGVSECNNFHTYMTSMPCPDLYTDCFTKLSRLSAPSNKHPPKTQNHKIRAHPSSKGLPFKTMKYNFITQTYINNIKRM